MKRFLIIVEGDADKKFFRDYYHHLFQEKAPENSIIFPKDKNDDTGGKGKLKSEETLQALRQNTNQEGVNLVLTIPVKKTKVNAYLETLLGKSRSQKKLIKDPYRNYENTQHWNLDAEYLEPLKEFLFDNIQ